MLKTVPQISSRVAYLRRQGSYFRLIFEICLTERPCLVVQRCAEFFSARQNSKFSIPTCFAAHNFPSFDSSRYFFSTDPLPRQ